jgi:hypothetical protein
MAAHRRGFAALLPQDLSDLQEGFGFIINQAGLARISHGFRSVFGSAM